MVAPTLYRCREWRPRHSVYAIRDKITPQLSTLRFQLSAKKAPLAECFFSLFQICPHGYGNLNSRFTGCVAQRVKAAVAHAFEYLIGIHKIHIRHSIAAN